MNSNLAMVTVQGKEVLVPDPRSDKASQDQFALLIAANVSKNLNIPTQSVPISVQVPNGGGSSSSLSALDRVSLDSDVIRVPVDIELPVIEVNPNQCLPHEPVCVSVCSHAEAYAVASASATGFGFATCSDGTTAWAVAGASAFAAAEARATACARACSDGRTETFASFSSFFSFQSSFFGFGGVN
ncbi:MAG: hypothetical protein ACKOA8_13165 [Deltaproteobacteria bacterium]